MKYIIVAFFFSFLPELLFSQQEIVAKFIITESTLNGRDHTQFDMDRGGYFTFYSENGYLLLANYSSKWNQQSYGPLIDYSRKHVPGNENDYPVDVFSFRWKYNNTYDNKSGYATVKFYKIYKPQGVIFVLGMILPNLDYINYTGYMEGSLDFSSFYK